MEPNNIEKQEEVEEIEEGKKEMTWWDWVQTISFLFVLPWVICFWIGRVTAPHTQPEKVIDGASNSLNYSQGYDEGVKFGKLLERSKWCEPEKYRKPGDMTLDCLKLFLEGAGSTMMEKNGIKIEKL